MRPDQRSLLAAPQLGEFAWHSFAIDDSLASLSEQHFERIAQVLGQHLSGTAQPRVLEIGTYRHYSGYLLEEKAGCEATLTDISRNSLSDGLAAARRAGLKTLPRLVAADFHDLPFSDGYFDAAFVASSVHHTLRPEAVLREMFRVVRRGGLVLIENEPCERAFCLYQFRSNRQDSFTAFERFVHEQGLMNTLSSPFWGSRPEELFGMVENDRIPLQLYRSVLRAHCDTVEFALDCQPQINRLETWLLKQDPGASGIHDAIAARLTSEFEAAAGHFGASDRLLGYSLPTACQLHSLATRAVTGLRALRSAEVDRESAMAELFGAALKAVLRNRTGAERRAAEPFRRSLVRNGEIWEEAPAQGSIAARLGEALLPDVFERSNAAMLDEWFPATDWDLVPEAIGTNSLLIKGAHGRVRLGELKDDAVLLLRFFAVAADAAPYKVRISDGDRVLDEQVIVLQESRLSRALIRRGTAFIDIDICDLEDNPKSQYGCFRISVCQLIRLRPEGAAIGQ
jgi:SAM-dependent methyltransferase